MRAFTTHDYLGGRDPQTAGFCNLDFLGGQLPLRVDLRHRHRAHGSNRGRVGGLYIKSLHTTAQVGGTNLFDVTNYQVYGAPSFGRIVYFGLLFDNK